MLPTITVIGNLKRVEYKVLPSGKAMTKFQIECAEKNKSGEWTNLYLSGECWEKSAEFVNQYFKDGSPAIVTGKMYTNVYEKSDGTKVYENKLLFPSVSFAPKDKSDNASGDNTSYQQQQQPQQVYQPQQQQQQHHTDYRVPPRPQQQAHQLPNIDTDHIPF